MREKSQESTINDHADKNLSSHYRANRSRPVEPKIAYAWRNAQGIRLSINPSLSIWKYDILIKTPDASDGFMENRITKIARDGSKSVYIERFRLNSENIASLRKIIEGEHLGNGRYSCMDGNTGKADIYYGKGVLSIDAIEGCNLDFDLISTGIYKWTVENFKSSAVSKTRNWFYNDL